MKTIKLLYIFTTFILVIASKKNFKQMIDFHTNLSADSDIYNNVTQILTSCKNNHEGITVFMDTSSNINSKWLSDLHIHFPGMMQLYDILQFHNLVKPLFFIKTEAVVCIIQSRHSFDNFLDGFYYEPSNSLSTLYIVNTSVNGCEMFKAAFEGILYYHILVVYFICSDDYNKVTIYTYSSLTRRIPEGWKLTEGQQYESRVLIYEKDYQGVDICENLYFDRTKFLHGHEVVIGIPPIFINLDEEIIFNYTDILYNDPNIFGITMYFFIDLLATALNTSIVLFQLERKTYKKNTDYSFPDFFHHYYHGLLERIKFDLLITSSNIENIEEDCMKTTYPIALSEFRMVMYNRGYQTPVEKMCDFYGIWTLLFTMFILTLVFMVIWHGERKKIAFAFFETIRLLISQSLHTQIRSLPIRIFFGVIFIYFLVIQATFNGNLAKFLTKPELRRHFETLEDLQDVNKNSIFFITDVEERITKVNIPSVSELGKICVNYIISNDTSAVCINTFSGLFWLVYNNTKLYMNKKSVSTTYVKHIMPITSHLNERIYKYSIWYTDLGFAQFSLRLHEKNKFYYERAADTKFYYGFQPINIDNLTFDFIFLTFGLAIATLSFFIERYCTYKIAKSKERNCYFRIDYIFSCIKKYIFCKK